MDSSHDTKGERLPIKLDSTSNGEYVPLPLEPVHKAANLHALEKATERAKHLGMNRRNFLVSASGAASTLLAFNSAYANIGKVGGKYDVSAEMAFDIAQAESTISGDQFILDVQGHFVNPEGAWLNSVPKNSNPLQGMPKASCDLSILPGERSYLDCLNAKEFVKDVFLDSDTDIMVLTFVPSARAAEPLTIEEAYATRDIVEQLDGTKRLLVHGRVNPNQDGDLQGMDELAEHWQVSAWKTYTQWGPDGKGFSFMDDVGQAFIEKARKLGIRNICVHKGLPFGPQSYEHSLCSDIGPAAKQNPDINFLVYHSGYVAGKDETAYDPNHNEGIDSLIKTVLENDISEQGNVYAELGSTWRLLMRDPDSAAHTLGKLFKHLGPEQVLWGTDSIWYGSPQDQIQAFRSFQISEIFQEQFGYQPISDETRDKVFGLNAAPLYGISVEEIKNHTLSDRVASNRAAYQEAPNPHFLTHGPKNRREFMNLMQWSQ